MKRAYGEGCLRSDGYVVRWRDGRPVMEHVMVAEKALGGPLPPGAKVHHWDENKANNAPTNLVICPSEAYHQLLHRRMRAMDACGNPDWRLCTYCGRHDDPSNLFIRRSDKQAWHKQCRREHDNPRS